MPDVRLSVVEPKRILRALSLSLLVLLATAPAMRCQSTQPQAPEQPVDSDVPVVIDHLTHRILKKELELERFNLNYRTHAARQGRWKGWRYFAFQETSNALSEAGLIVAVRHRTKNYKTPSRVNPHVVEDGTVTQAIGQIIAGSGSAIEFLINAGHMLQAHCEGFSSRQATKYVIERRDVLYNLLAQREALIIREGNIADLKDQASLAEGEGQVLREIADLTLHEYESFHIAATRTLVMQQSLYLLDVARNTTGALGNYYGYQSLQQRNRHLNTPAGYTTIISGGLTLLNPIVSRTNGVLAAAIDRRLLSKYTRDCATRDVARLRADVAGLENQLKSSPDSGTSRTAELLTHTKLFDLYVDGFARELNMRTREAHKGNLDATENIATGALVGGAKVANGIQYTIAGGKYYNSALHTNILLGSGNTAFLPANSWALLDNLRIQVSRETTNYQLKKQQLLPSQMIKHRMEQLDSLEQELARLAD